MLHKLARGLEVAAADSAEGTKRAFGQLRKGQFIKSQEEHFTDCQPIPPFN